MVQEDKVKEAKKRKNKVNINNAHFGNL